MKAATGLLAVLLLLSSTSLAQTPQTQPATPGDQPTPAQPTAPAQQAVPTPQAVADASKPEAAGQPPAATAPPPAAPSTEAAATTTDAAPAVPDVAAAPAFAPGMKLFIEKMNGFEQRLAYAMVKKKVPVVLVDDRDKADFILTGGAFVKEQGFFKAWIATAHGKGTILVNDARTGDQVFSFSFHRVDSNETADETLQIWAGVCANHLKKALEPKKK